MSNQQSDQNPWNEQNPYYANNHQSAPPPAHNFQSNNPWADQSGHPPTEHQHYQQQPGQQSYQAYAPPPGPPPSHQHQQYQGYAPPSGPPPGHAPPKRADTFKESDFVPDSERGEQREAMQQFEMNHSGQQSQADRDVEALQREFPGMDSSLIAALYSDAGSMGATREMLQELSQQGK